MRVAAARRVDRPGGTNPCPRRAGSGGPARQPLRSKMRPAAALHTLSPAALRGPGARATGTARGALLEVLRGVEHVRRSLPAQGAAQDLGGGEGERLLVDVDEVPMLAERAPQGARVVDEQCGVGSRGPQAGDRLAGGAPAGRRPPSSQLAVSRSTSTPERSAALAPARRRRRRCARPAARALVSTLPATTTLL